ncbi:MULTISPECIES: hypothetical protein [unclassified Microcoleus]|uniref:hypothetical protein n=1 Tax=unclassified Microcoleus TaxID=2642155 RepID=UPI002FD1D182
MNATLEEKLDRPLLFPGLTWKQFKTLELTSCTIVNNRLSGLFHNKIYLLWNRPDSLFLSK